MGLSTETASPGAELARSWLCRSVQQVLNARPLVLVSCPIGGGPRGEGDAAIANVDAGAGHDLAHVGPRQAAEAALGFGGTLTSPPASLDRTSVDELVYALVADGQCFCDLSQRRSGGVQSSNSVLVVGAGVVDGQLSIDEATAGLLRRLHQLWIKDHVSRTVDMMALVKPPRHWVCGEMPPRNDSPAHVPREQLENFFEPQATHDLLVEHAAAALRNEQWVNFGEAGDDSQQPLHRVIVDLPVRRGAVREQALHLLMRQGEHVLKRSLTAGDLPRHAILTGAPGNGKSTISRYIVQLYRMAFMAKDIPSQAIFDLATGTKASMERMGVSLPRQQRWPMRIDLADWASGDNRHSGYFVKWLAFKIGERAGREVTVADVRRWLRGLTPRATRPSCSRCAACKS